MTEAAIAFHEPTRVGDEGQALLQALAAGRWQGDGGFTRGCHDWLETWTGCEKALLTPSGTAALELCIHLLALAPGDEVILPSYTFSSCANAVILGRGVPVFVDVEPATLSIDPAAMEAAITPRTKAVMVVHYGGVIGDMARIMEIAARHDLVVIEDAAQALGSFHGGQPAGSFGDMAAFSFHATKNITCGEGGAFVTRCSRYAEAAEIIREKGTDRSRFLAGLVDKYTWVALGSSYLPSEFQAALLSRQLHASPGVTEHRRGLWRAYRERLAPLEREGRLTLLHPPEASAHNGHVFAVLLAEGVERADVMARLQDAGIGSAFHYLPLHSARAGRKFGRAVGAMSVTERAGRSLLRLPLHGGLTEAQAERAAGALSAILRAR